MKKLSIERKVFLAVDYILLTFIAMICLLPLINVLAISFSGSSAVTAGMVKLWPVDFTFKAYEYVASKREFMKSFLVTVQRVLLGLVVNMILTFLVAYPLSKDDKKFRFRKVYAWYFVITILFSGGLIPWYITITKTGLINSIWALIIPSAVPVFNIIILLNFFKEIPGDIEEASFIDGAGHWTVLWKIYLPLSLPALATLTLFTVVSHWNSWFDGLILMNSPDKYPLQSYLQTVVINRDLTLISSTDVKEFADISDRTTKAAQVFIAAVPILLLYPFLQKYFMNGLVLGSVKG